MTDESIAGPTITIDGKSYELSTLSEQARAQVTNLRVTDAELERLKAHTAIFQTARITYAKALKAELDKTEPN